MSACERVWVRVGACVGGHYSIFTCSSSFIFFSVIIFLVFSSFSFPLVFHVSCFCVSFLFSIFMFTVFRALHSHLICFFLSLGFCWAMTIFDAPSHAHCTFTSTPPQDKSQRLSSSVNPDCRGVGAKKDVQPEQHEEAQPKKKAKGLDLVSGGENCKQTSAVLCGLWHNSQVFNAQPGEALGRNAAQAVTDNVKRFAKNGWDAPMEECKKCNTWEAKREFALKLATDKTASFIRVTQTEPLKSQIEVSDVTGWLHIWEIADPLPPVRPRHDGKVDALRFWLPVAAERETRTCRRRRVVIRLPQEARDETLGSPIVRSCETTTDEQGFHEAKDAINAEDHAMPMSTKTKSKTSRSSTPRGSLEDDKADKTPSKKALWMRAANATKTTLQRALDDLEKAVEQFETAIKKGKVVSKSYITKMRGSGKALETWKTKIVKELANVEKLTEDVQRDRPPLSCLWCNTFHA